MTLPRSLFAGATNYMGSSLEDIVAHLKDWRNSTQEVINTLTECRLEVLDEAERLDDCNSVLYFIDYFVQHLVRYLKDFDRLIRELPAAVEERHIELVRALAEYSPVLDRSCVNFKQDHISKGLKDEGMRRLVDTIYSEARSIAIDYLDLSNVQSRLKTFVGTRREVPPISINDVDAIELKPNFFGLGINLNHLIKRLGQWWKKRKAKL